MSEFSKQLEIIKGIDNEIGIDITYCHEARTLWLRFLCFYLTIVYRKKGAEVMAKCGEWIKVKTRPLTAEEKEEYGEAEYVFDCEIPDDGQEVLITSKYGVAFTTYYEYYGGYFECYEGENEVLAWMPLPKPFEKEKK